MGCPLSQDGHKNKPVTATIPIDRKSVTPYVRVKAREWPWPGKQTEGSIMAHEITVGGTKWIGITTRGASLSWFTADEAAALGQKLVERYSVATTEDLEARQ